MARVIVSPGNVSLWVSQRETRRWAQRDGSAWPCSVVAGKRLHLEFDSNGTVGTFLNCGRDQRDIPSHELSSIAFDFLKGRIPIDHPCWPVVIGQFIHPGDIVEIDAKEVHI